MGVLVLKKEVKDKIKKDPVLFGRIFGKQPGSLDTTVSYGLKLIDNNDDSLTSANVLRILREHLGDVQDNDLLEEIPNEKPETIHG